MRQFWFKTENDGTNDGKWRHIRLLTTVLFRIKRRQTVASMQQRRRERKISELQSFASSNLSNPNRIARFTSVTATRGLSGIKIGETFSLRLDHIVVGPFFVLVDFA
jgi:hypothetical protein